MAELADRLTSQYGCQVLIGGSSADLDLAQQIQQMTKSRPTIMAGRTTIKQFAAIAKRSALFVGSDSGAMHIAAAVGTSVVALLSACLIPASGALVVVLQRYSIGRSIAVSVFIRLVREANRIACGSFQLRRSLLQRRSLLLAW